MTRILGNIYVTFFWRVLPVAHLQSFIIHFFFFLLLFLLLLAFTQNTGGIVKL